LKTLILFAKRNQIIKYRHQIKYFKFYSFLKKSLSNTLGLLVDATIALVDNNFTLALVARPAVLGFHLL